MHAGDAIVGARNRNSTIDVSEDWLRWCRLCGKDDVQNINIFFKDEHMVTSEGNTEQKEFRLAIAIGKYFCVQIKQDEILPKRLCAQCFSLVTSLVNFNERVAKIQQMYAALHSFSDFTHVDFQSLRLRYGALNNDRPHEINYHPLAETHFFEAKPKTNDYEEKSFIEEAEMEIASQESRTGIEIKKESSTDNTPATDEDIIYNIFEFENEDADGEDPFGSGTEVSNDKTIDSVGNDKVKIYTCSECSQSFKRISYFRSHMKHKHAKVAAEKKFVCCECHFSFNTRAQLNHHAAKHLRSFICEECGEAVRSKGQLKQHMLTHTDYAPFECEVCTKRFKNQVRLKNHMETHNSNKLICDECGLQLNSRATLNRHLLVHSDVMQHKCDYCGRAFKRAKALKNHLILHTGLKPYSCDFCDRTFANGSNCRTHKRKSHPEELAALEASGEKTYTKNIPKLAVLKSVTRAAENLAPVVSKQSGNFAFGKKPKLPPDSIGTVSRKQAKACKQSAVSITATNEIFEKYNNVTSHSIHSVAQSKSQHSNEDNNTAVRHIPTIDNIYSQLMKQATPNSGCTVVPATITNPSHLDTKPPSNEESVGIDITNAIAQDQLSQHMLLPSQQSAIPSAVQSFCTQLMKQHKTTIKQQLLELHQQHDEISIHSPESHGSHHAEEHPAASATATKVNQFYNQMSQHTPDTYL
ncbi:zinc finger protein weckle-like [Anastrepha obliqua]|uniref:zinc finger protein weckle-like n=1 Tax=Anastrepha obliqua TaxID=95512 RepID=UPI002409B7BB|nr:zinc finger protein weckle-like [Anastrepha obliqua]